MYMEWKPLEGMFGGTLMTRGLQPILPKQVESIPFEWLDLNAGPPPGRKVNAITRASPSDYNHPGQPK